MLGPLELLQRVLAEIDDLRAGGKLGREQCARRLGDEHLTAVGGAGDPRPANDVEPEIPLFAEGRLARPQAPSHLALSPSRPSLGPQSLLHRESATDGIARSREGAEERVALS